MIGFDHETLLVKRGERSGVEIVIAVHSTRLGPSLGGCRVWPFGTVDEAIADALRLSQAMTLKAAVAGLGLGGGKGVIRVAADAPVGEPAWRVGMLEDFAEAVNELGGRYITAEDVGTTSADMAVVARSCEHVVGRPVEAGGSGDPAPYTAAGVAAAMRACLRDAFGSPDVGGRSVAVIGLGAVGERLARELSRRGAALLLADVDKRKARLADELGGAWVTPDAALHAEVDVLAPCALGGAIDGAAAENVRCRIVCGAANNQLASDGLAERLAARGIVFAPDFIANAGGLINVALELDGYDAAVAMRRALAIEGVMGRVLDHARGTRVTPLAAALQLAARRLGRTQRRAAGGLSVPPLAA